MLRRLHRSRRTREVARMLVALDAAAAGPSRRPLPQRPLPRLSLAHPATR